MAAQIGFFLESFDKQFVCAAIYLPIDIAGRFSGVVEAMFGKFDRKTVKWAAGFPLASAAWRDKRYVK